ncbi:Ornithine carbamoyltransferase [Methyloligella halotolerans]|uniref:Ornithine carbamoyltransferase n=1 Tax=Methyloligella halotolerans TaxID=1177755 RepID=A0A1E2RXT5_9HYPH|nr:ornithine carbamoyltransferase [Methyloligella halotolerans]ODA67047.1 Ornithine carbamoyltransferase [Methyloligella halotolerans]
MQKATTQISHSLPQPGASGELRHFLDIGDLDTATLKKILAHAHEMKAERKSGPAPLLPGAVLAMIFEKPSTRTRVSFEVAIHELGGKAVVLNPNEMQLGRGETIADTAKVLSRYVDAIMLRTGPHDTLLELAGNADVPVINGLTGRTHPCQIMADIMTYEERKGSIEGATVAWVGDANNVAASWIHAAARFGFALKIAAPKEYPPAEELVAFARAENADVVVTQDPGEAATDADCIVTDVWVSMGDADGEQRKKLLRPYQVNAALMEKAKSDAIFMHCLPAHRDDEVTAEVIDGPQSVVWDEAENRLHAQKAILAWCLESKSKQLGD